MRETYKNGDPFVYLFHFFLNPFENFQFLNFIVVFEFCRAFFHLGLIDRSWQSVLGSYLYSMEENHPCSPTDSRAIKALASRVSDFHEPHLDSISDDHTSALVSL